MTAPVKKPVRKISVPPWHAGFRRMLPQIRRCAEAAFRTFPAEARQEAVQECIANALVAYLRLVQLDRVSLAYPTVLARCGIAQLNEGRRVGSPPTTLVRQVAP